MKKYEYKTLTKSVSNENFTSFALLLNKYGEDGWRVIDISWSDGGNTLSVFLEREIPTNGTPK